MNIPRFTAEASLERSSNAYIGSFGPGGWRREAIVPAIASTCPGVNCDALLASAILLFNPVSWGWYKACCMGDSSNEYCRANPCLEECRHLNLCAAPPTLTPGALSSEGFSDLSSQITTLENDLKRQLNRIERCACGIHYVTKAPVSPFPIREVIVPPIPLPPVPPII